MTLEQQSFLCPGSLTLLLPSCLSGKLSSFKACNMTILRHRRESEGKAFCNPCLPGQRVNASALFRVTAARSPPATPMPSAGGHSRTNSVSSASTSSPPISPPAGTMVCPGSAPATGSAAAATALPPIPSDPNKKRHIRVPHLGRGSSNDEKHKKEPEKKPTSAPAAGQLILSQIIWKVS